MDVIHDPGEISLVKSEVSVSAPEGYTLNDTIQYDIALKNNTEMPLFNVEVLDLFDGDTAGVKIGDVPVLMPGEEVHYGYACVVTEEYVNAMSYSYRRKLPKRKRKPWKRKRS